MGRSVAGDFWEGPGLVRLIGSFLLAPFAWLLDMQVSYSLVKWACMADRRDVLLLVPVGSLTMMGVATLLAWTCWTRLRGKADPDGGSLVDRSYLLVMAAFAMNALFALLVVTSYAPRLWLSPCE